MDIDLCGGAYESFSKNLNSQECVNFFVHIDQTGGVSKKSLRGFPGLKVWCDTGEYAEVRGVQRMGPFIYAVVGYKVFRVSKAGTVTECTGTLGTSSGAVSMATDGQEVVVVDGTRGYSVSGTTVTKITDASFPSSPKTVTEQDGYFIVSGFGSEIAYPSSYSDGTSYDTTDAITAGGQGDNLLTVLSDHRDIIMFCENTIDVFYNTGSGFSRKPGYFQEIGLGAIYSPAKLDNGVFFLSDTYQVIGHKKPVSTREIEYQIAQDSDRENAIGMSVGIEGNTFYILTTSNNTWCFNASTGFWNKLASYPEPFGNRWRGNCSEYFDNKNIVGDYQNGILYELDFDTYTDNSETIVRKRIGRTLTQENKMIFPHRLEIFFEPGVGLVTGQGSDPQAMLRYSIDGGHTWSSEIWRDIGQIGEYKNRAIWHRFYSGRQFTPELTISDPVKCVITGANLEASIGIT